MERLPRSLERDLLLLGLRERLRLRERERLRDLLLDLLQSESLRVSVAIHKQLTKNKLAVFYRFKRV